MNWSADLRSGALIFGAKSSRPRRITRIVNDGLHMNERSLRKHTVISTQREIMQHSAGRKPDGFVFTIMIWPFQASALQQVAFDELKTTPHRPALREFKPWKLPR